ncbi:unnamed protein product [Meloidogyne enterolobii]|uniref:Uncharacterized protein n=1 Tax=Meloidogyne enterolobii TaxID=390850 RepID=A0ACB1B1S6_MELEN
MVFLFLMFFIFVSWIALSRRMFPKCINKYFEVYAENYFEEPDDCINYSLFYFEIKVKIEGEKFSWISIDLRNDNKEAISLRPLFGVIENEKRELFKLDDFSWNDEDIFGCGLVYPPTEKNKKLPYMFYTKNGEQIGLKN